MKKRYLLLISSLSLCALFNCGGKDGEVIILFTNDTHGEINGNLSFATVGAMKKSLSEEGKNVLLFDSGDIISGGFYTSYNKGECMIDLMNDANYDAATLGNHEFDYEFTHLTNLMNKAKFPFLSSNFYHMQNGVATTRFTDLGSKVFNLNNINIGVVGVSTPESITTSTPSHFQDEHGNYIYTFMDEKIYETVQKEIDTIKDKCDYVICLSHLGDDTTNKYCATELVKNTAGIDVVLDGHTHFNVIGNKVKDKNGKEVLITQAGGKFSRIGKLTISKKRGIKNELISESLEKDETIKNKENNIVSELDKRLGTKIATNTVNFKTLGGNECNLGDLSAEAFYYYYNVVLPSKGEDTSADVTFVNTGGLRSEVTPGDWTLKTSKNIHPFGNGVALVKMTGKLLKIALEFSSYKMPTYFGGLQQTCGVKYDVDVSKTSTAQVDEHGNYIKDSIKDTFRIENIQIFNKQSKEYETLDENREYLVGGSSYVLVDGGDGCSMFKEAEFIRKESDVVDADVLSRYIQNFDKGDGDYPVVSADNSPLKIYGDDFVINYDNSTGCGNRIHMINA